LQAILVLCCTVITVAVRSTAAPVPNERSNSRSSAAQRCAALLLLLDDPAATAHLHQCRTKKHFQKK